MRGQSRQCQCPNCGAINIVAVPGATHSLCGCGHRFEISGHIVNSEFFEQVARNAAAFAAERQRQAKLNWRVDSIEVPPDVPAADTTVAAWLVHDSTNLAWDQYGVGLVHLRGTATDGTRAHLHMPNATHEWWCFALHPDHRVSKETPAHELLRFRLTPMNMGYQFHAESDAAAMERLEAALSEAPSMDTDYRRWWNERFADGYALVRSALTGE